MIFFLCFATSFIITVSSSCTPPNNLQNQLHFGNCNQADAIQIRTLQLQYTSTGATDYPVDLTKPFTIVANSQNTGTTTYNAIRVDVDLAHYSKGLFGFGDCEWRNIPTFGLLNDIHQCGNCPLKPGPISMSQAVDISRYSAIISGLAGGGAYQLTVHLKNDNDGSDSGQEEIACIVIQGIISK